MTGEFAAAVHALVVLNHKNTTVSSEALSKNVCTHPARLRRVLAKLKKTGLVESREGTEGGYSFSGDPAM
jgi:DNA-binding IscR family transcriptional regulator